MAVTVRLAPYGPAAFEALCEVLTAWRGRQGHPLAAATVVVPENRLGIVTPRALARRGIVGVTCCMLRQLAESLAGDHLGGEGRRPVSEAVLAGTVRQVLQTPVAGVFAEVRGHIATERALMDAHRRLRNLPDVEVAALASASRRGTDVVNISRQVRRRLDGLKYHDYRDLLEVATSMVNEVVAGSIPGEIDEDLGIIVVYQPQRPSAPELDLLAALAESGAPFGVIAGVSGSPEADEPVAAAVRRLAGPEAWQPPPVAVPAPTRIMALPDADEEVRTALRGVMEALRRGVPLERMAVLYGRNDPYARLLHDQLLAAGLPFGGALVRPLAETTLGRFLLGLLGLPGRRFGRADVMAWLSAAPIRGAGDAAAEGHGRWRPLPVSAWERVSRRSGVLHDGEGGEWGRRLTSYCVSRQTELARLGEENAWRLPGIQLNIALAEGLQRFMAELAERFEAAAGMRRWRDLARWADRTIWDMVGGAAWRRQNWPAHEADAAERIDEIIERLGGLDAVDPEPNLARFQRALEAEFAGTRVGHGRLGLGLLVGPVGAALGTDLDCLWVLGLAEGVFPGQALEDALLSEAERAAAPGLLPPASRLVDDHRGFLAALAAASGERTLLFPRGDLRRTSARLPSRWLLESAQSLLQTGAGVSAWSAASLDDASSSDPSAQPTPPVPARSGDSAEGPTANRAAETPNSTAPESPESERAASPPAAGAEPTTMAPTAKGVAGVRVGGVGVGSLLRANDLAGVPGGVFSEVPSATAALRACGFPATRQEYDLRCLLDHAAGGGRLADHPLAGAAGPLYRPLELLAARRSRAFTRFDGNLVGCNLPSPADEGRVVSATQLENWAACPHGYFMRYLLGVQPVDQPERELKISPVERGDLIHTILDRFLREVLAAGAPEPTDRWAPNQRARLSEIAEEAFAEREGQGRVGQRIFWLPERRRLVRQLLHLLDLDERWRAREGRRPWASEKGFAVPVRFAGEQPLPAAEIRLDDGRMIRLQGAVDRIDTTLAGGLVVIDYKSGRSDDYKRLGERPWALYAGKGRKGAPKVEVLPRLQLPIYAHAARAALAADATSRDPTAAPPASGAPVGGASPTPPTRDATGVVIASPGGGLGLPGEVVAVTAGYWFVSAAERDAWLPLELDAELEAELRWTLATMTDGIAAGVFPAFPRSGHCDYCPGEANQAAVVAEQLARKKADPALDGWLRVGARELLPEDDVDRMTKAASRGHFGRVADGLSEVGL